MHPAARRRIELLGGLGFLLLVVGMVGAVVLSLDGVPAAFAVAPIVAGAALSVVACVRWWDLAAETARGIGTGGAAWGSSTSPPPDSSGTGRAGFGRSPGVATGITAAIAAVVIVLGGSAAVQPVVADAGRSFASTFTEAGSDDLALPYTSDDGTIDVTLIDGDAWDATCAATPGDQDCWTWEVDAVTSCEVAVTIGFATTETGPDTRSVTRAVRVTADRPLYIAELGDEVFAGIESAECLPRSAHEIDVTQTPADDMAYESAPDGCDITGCVGFVLVPEEDCANASVQFLVADEWYDVPDPHDLVVDAELHSGEPTTVFAGGVESFEGTATLAHVTCAVTDPTDTPTDEEPTA